MNILKVHEFSDIGQENHELIFWRHQEIENYELKFE